ncbi:MAG: isoprenyl transferase [Kiritimatiellae bacterium]|nr:isoprenyl transferase [Kiritimatiellia bacterium]MDD4735220.1 isoprenyl transferase [Kiritimatiellia bacterium]
MKQKTTLRTPRHIAIIMDGNGRWAKKQGFARVKGHEAGAESVRTAIRCCRNAGVQYLTLYAFSVENWVRPKAEVAALMQLLRRFLKNNEHELHENQVRLRVSGRLQDLPEDVQREINRVMEATKHYDAGQLILALSYGGRTELTEAMQKIARQVKAGELPPESITEETITQNLYLPDVPDPDLMIRTSGELRLSNFLLWQLSYAELYFDDVLWPDFREPHFQKALENYSKRKRRFGDIE